MDRPTDTESDSVNPTDPASEPADPSNTMPAPERPPAAVGLSSAAGPRTTVPQVGPSGDTDGGTLPAGSVPPGGSAVAGSTAHAGQPRAGRAAPLPAIPGYAIEGELGRGGMGVVYLARQTALKRRVALKLIRAGADASPEQLDRFRLEAEAVASLQHPNIVQVYEVGEYDGCPYCTLEFVSGGSLAAAAKERPFTPAAAAELVETLARAMHHAHQRGVVHRDLKPANILVGAGGVPKVTDFGLAKRLEDGESGRTRTGDVMGTPAYMPPEQAAGKTQQLGPPADIYALGAILYELLAGRPPFKGESVMDTLQQVLNDEPVPPSRLAPGVSRDLETICLKCLEKDPAARYHSALALAQDLERFRAGEPILARREGVVRRSWRKLRRRRLAAGLLAAAVVAAGLAGWGLTRAGSARETVRLTGELNDGLDAADWTPEHVARLEGLVARLEAVEPAEGAAARRRLLDRAAKRFRDALARPRVAAADVPALEGELKWLADRDPDAARELDQEFRRRLRSWQPVAALAPPFADAAAVFPPGRVRVEPAGLVADAGPLPVLARVPCAGPVRVEAEFAPGWEAAAEFGVVVRLSPDPANPAGYSFLLAAVPRRDIEPGGPPANPGERPTFRSGTAQAVARIVRNGVVLRERSVPLPPGPVRVLGEREGDTLRMRVNGQPAAEFADAFPLAGEGQLPGVAWPPGGAVASFRADVHALPPAASPLERADDLFDRGRFAEAAALYQEQARAGGEAGAEARCKAGVCLARLNRPDEAAAAFEGVMALPGDRWPVVAAGQLWLLRLGQKKYDEADAVFATVSGRFGREQLARNVPLQVREEIAKSVEIPPVNYFLPDPAAARRAEAAAKLGDLLKEEESRIDRLYPLLILLALSREDARAVEVGRDIIPLAMDRGTVGPHGTGWFPWTVRWYCWELRQTGRRKEAADLITGWLAEYPRRAPDRNPYPDDPDWFKRAYLPVLLEKARVAADSNAWADAEDALDLYLKEFPKPFTNYSLYAPAYLMKGFCRMKRGDPAGAAKAWKEGRYAAYLDTLPADRRPAGLVPPGRHALLDNWVLGSLTGELTDDEAKETWAALTGTFTADPVVTQFANSFQIGPAVLRETWRSDRGKSMARKFAFQELHPLDHYRAPVLLMMAEKMRQDLFGGKATADQDEVVWQAVSRLSAEFFAGRLAKAQVLPLALAWKGTLGVLGWGGLAGQLKPEVRGPLAYLLGLRLVKLGRPADAKPLFRTAHDDAPADSPLRRLAKDELDRGGK